MQSLFQDKAPSTDKACNCHDPIECLRQMFVDVVQKGRAEAGQCPVRRPVFLRTHGIMKGTMEMLPSIPESLQKGMFAPPLGSHPVYVRYSSDLSDGRPDWKSTIGIGIKIFNVPGEKVVSDDGANTADLLFQNVPFFFVDTARDMCGFTKASLAGKGDAWVQANAPNTNKLLDAMAKPVMSVLETTLWSVVPFRLGDGHYCKYILRPGVSTFAGEFDVDDPNFLAKDLHARMAAGEATLDIYIQARPTTAQYSEAYLDKHFPLDKATVIWDERVAKPIKVATIRLPQQNLDDAQQATYGDWLAFNIGRVPKENEPVGSIAEARMSVYQASATYRRTQNEQPLSEPTAPGEPTIQNPKCSHMEEQPIPLSAEQMERICSVRIHPGIGIARVGNSSSFYIGPEVMQPTRTGFGETRDKSGAIKRQAARFRVYGYDSAGNVVAEIQQSANATVKWTVQLANKKAAWYRFNAAMDIPATKALTVPLRNANVKGADRQSLIIDTGEKNIMGINSKDSSYQMSGEFQGTSVMLGELRTDAVGRLLVLPGQGVSASPSNQPIYIESDEDSFNNADGWYDDIADGPVNATVSFGDKVFQADAAWVCSAPPNYAPDMIGWRTLDDLLQDLYIRSGLLPLPNAISFNEHVRPILERLSGLQWVNAGFAAMFGVDAPMNFGDTSFMQKLSLLPNDSHSRDTYAELRRTVYNAFRTMDNTAVEPRTWPWIYGDTFGYSGPKIATEYLALPSLFDHILQQWVKGNFSDDYAPNQSYPTVLSEVPLQKQPEMLDRANLHFCLADAFHPGCELTWPVRNASMYRAPYRFKVRPAGEDEPVYGSNLSAQIVASIDGPLYEQGAGDLTRWMALPWQADTAFCRSGYDKKYDPYLPTFWPARVPNQILTEADYQILCDSSQNMETRIAAFHTRAFWTRILPPSDSAPEQMEYMVAHFSKMGIVEALPRPADMEWLPAFIYVENLPVNQKEQLEQLMLNAPSAMAPDAVDAVLSAAGWASEAQESMFIRVRKRGN